jgi:murein DD-endopeptidase MepM/ murein hydrolase activator NlpD
MFRFRPLKEPLPPILDRFGVRSRGQVVRDLRVLGAHLFRGERYAFDLRSAGLLRPDLSLPAYAGLLPSDGLSPIYNFFDRTGGGLRWRGAVTRSRQRDWRGGRLSYDEHDGTDFVCPPGTPVASAAPGIVAAVRDNWLRGGLTACVDHGDGVVTQYTHLTSVVAELGQPVERGEILALSGVSGFDIAQFFPLVPPHVHFMVWIDGRPVDPYLAPGEDARPGTWVHPNEPRSARGALPGDILPSRIQSDVDEAAIEAVVDRCADPRVRREIEDAGSAVARAAILEDSFQHESHLWPDDARAAKLRRPGDPSRVALTMPLTAELYRGARVVDRPWTRGRASRSPTAGEVD